MEIEKKNIFLRIQWTRYRMYHAALLLRSIILSVVTQALTLLLLAGNCRSVENSHLLKSKLRLSGTKKAYTLSFLVQRNMIWL